MPTTTAPKTFTINDISLAPGVDLSALLDKDDSPLQFVVNIEAASQASARLLDRLMERAKAGRLAGGKGHQTAEQITHQFQDPALHYVGGAQDGQIYGFRGVVDPSQPDLKRWIRSSRVRFEPTSNGSALSLDAMPLDRAAGGGAQAVVIENSADEGKPAESSNTGTDTTSDGQASDGQMRSTSGSAGEIHDTNNVMAGLRVRRKSTTPYGEIGSYSRPADSSEGTTTTTITDTTMSGWKTRRRSI